MKLAHSQINTRAVIIISIITFAAGCSTQTVEPTPAPIKQEIIEVVKEEPKEEPKAVIKIATPEPIIEKVVIAPPKPPTQASTVYFNFDSSELDEDAKNIITTHIQFLQKNPEFTVTLEGHADTRGSDDYNTILGSKRAQTIKELLISEDVNENQINLVSYGEKKPAVIGNSTSAWRSNRRAIFVYSYTNELKNSTAEFDSSSPKNQLVLDE